MPKERRARAETGNRRITTKEADDVEEMSSPRTPAIYQIVRRLGDEEMDRPITSLWWSGVAAGLSISFSLLAQGILQAHLPEASWTPLIGSLGYSVGFLVVLSNSFSRKVQSRRYCRLWPALLWPISGDLFVSGASS